MDKVKGFSDLAAYDAAYASMLRLGVSASAPHANTLTALIAEGIFGGGADNALRRYCEKRPDRSPMGVWSDVRDCLSRSGITDGVDCFVRNAVQAALAVEQASFPEVEELRQELAALSRSGRKGGARK